MLYLTRQWFFWVNIRKDVRNHVLFGMEPEPEGLALLENINTTAPLEFVCIDFCSAEESNKKMTDVLVITDHFTKLAHAFHCPDQMPFTVLIILPNPKLESYGTIIFVSMGFLSVFEFELILFLQ